MCVKKYQAHAFCKHPDKRTAVGDDWTQHIEIELCKDAQLAKRHAQRRNSEVMCEEPGWRAVVNPLLHVWCDACQDNDSEWSAANMRGGFEAARDGWQEQGVLDESELRSIQRDIDRALRRQKDEANGPRGPFNNSYYVLQEALETYMAYWEKYVEEKKEALRRMEEEREMEEAWRQARVGNRVDEAVETSIYPPGHLAQAEASRAQDDSRHVKRPRKHNALAQLFGGKRRPKRK